MQKAVIYIRASTAKQEYSPEAQLESLLRFCDYRRMAVLGIWGDPGKSGRKRTERLLGRAEAIRVAKATGATLLCYSLSRLGRSLKELAAIVDDIGRENVALVTVAEGVDTSTSAGRLVAGILASVAQFEAEAISERTKAGLEIAKKRGRIPGPKASDDPNVVDMALWLQSREIPLSGIAKQLNENGFRTSGGSEFTHVQVRRLLNRSERSAN